MMRCLAHLANGTMTILDRIFHHIKKAADIIEASSLDYTVLRPAWLTNNDEIEYETTVKGENFKGTEVSRKSVAALGLEIIENPSIHVKKFRRK